MNDEPVGKVRSLWGEAWHRLHANVLAMLCLGVMCLFLLAGLLDIVPLRFMAPGPSATVRERTVVDWAFARIVGPTNKEESYQPPGVRGHALGTDIQGRDVLYLAVKGISTAVLLGGLTAAIYIPLGLLLGVVAGYFGGFVDDVIVYVYSTLACIPGILLLIALMTVMEPGLVNLCIALGITGWVGLCRLIRGETLKLRESHAVLATRALGASHSRIIFRHILPNLFHIVIISFTLGFSGIVMSEAVLTYIGVGVEPDRISWGQMIASAKMELSRDPSVWWQFAAAAGALFILVLAFNIFGDALRDAMDPRLRMGAMTE